MTTVVKKLQIKPGKELLILNSPADPKVLLGDIPDGTKTKIGGTFDIVLTFYKKMTHLESEVVTLKEAMGDGILWVSYPKGSSKVETDLNRDIIRAALEKRELKAVSMISIDDIWSSMRFKKV